MRVLRPLGGLFAAAVLLAACSGPPPGAAATVNDAEVSVEEFELMVRAQADNPDGPLAGVTGEARTGQLAQMQQQILTQLILVELIDQAASERGITVTEQEVDDRWEQEVAFQGSEEALQELLDSLGLTEEQARQQLAAGIKQEKLREALGEEIEVTDEQVRELFESREDQYERADVSHILVETEEEARAVLDLLEQGESFEDLARERSQDPGSAEQGGRLGSFPQGQYVPEFDEAVWGAEEGEVVGPVETQFGWHVIRVNSFEVSTFEDVEDTLREELQSGQLDQAFGEFITRLMSEADIQIDSRFGVWDPARRAVVAEEGIGDGSGTGTAPGDPFAPAEGQPGTGGTGTPADAGTGGQ